MSAVCLSVHLSVCLSIYNLCVCVCVCVYVYGIGGMISVFLMGVYDPVRDKFCTVAKCGNGHDDATLTRLQKELDMVKISKVK